MLSTVVLLPSPNTVTILFKTAVLPVSVWIDSPSARKVVCTLAKAAARASSRPSTVNLMALLSADAAYAVSLDTAFTVRLYVPAAVSAKVYVQFVTVAFFVPLWYI